MTSVPIDYRDFFEYRDLDKCHSKPDFTYLDGMKQQLMTNAQCVHSLSGKGDHGYLGLLLDPREYALISNTPFVRPVMPVVPNVTGASQHKTHRLQT